LSVAVNVTNPDRLFKMLAITIFTESLSVLYHQEAAK